MPDLSKISFCPRCGSRFTDEATMQIHMRGCTDIDEEYSGEIA